jgi:cellulose synthase/poly-beta-1,6-N-acetylglucosamine synthase-like glycosyltransferase
MNNLIHILTLIHFAALSGLALYGLHRLWLLYHWRQLVDLVPPTAEHNESTAQLCVTVQLPLYNERFVTERLIDAAAQLDWPAAALQIQVLDDSTDATCALVDAAIARWRRQGVNICVCRRDNRRGYKAGALADALATASGELIAIFDADFVPERDYLQRMIPHFADPGIGMVQARWGFLNREHSWLTQLQALLLGPHFGIEHQVRYRQGAFFNFNGTAGIWRRQAIIDAGGWQADTVTEDLDLSYRAQLAGWRFVYVNDIVVPSELPVTLNDFRSQQQRWAKGSMQTARKILPLMLRSSQPLLVKMEAVVHLLANLGWLCGALASITLYPALLGRIAIGPYQVLRIDAPLFLLACVAILLYFYLYAYQEIGNRALRWLPLLPLLTLGMAPTLAWAVLCGMVQRGGVFARTAKYGSQGQNKLSGNLAIYSNKSFRILALNGSFALYSCLPIVFAVQRETWLAIPFLLLFPLGFMVVFFKDALEAVALK